MSIKISIKPSRSRKNSIAKSLRDPLFRSRIIPNRKLKPKRERNELVKLLQQS